MKLLPLLAVAVLVVGLFLGGKLLSQKKGSLNNNYNVYDAGRALESRPKASDQPVPQEGPQYIYKEEPEEKSIDRARAQSLKEIEKLQKKKEERGILSKSDEKKLQKLIRKERRRQQYDERQAQEDAAKRAY